MRASASLLRKSPSRPPAAERFMFGRGMESGREEQKLEHAAPVIANLSQDRAGKKLKMPARMI